MRRHSEFSTALAITGAALGMDFATGRALSAFYAQLAQASWLGVALAAAIFGTFMGLLSHLARRTGADGMSTLLQRLPGGSRVAQALYGLIFALAAYMLLSEAGHAGALALPLRHGGLLGAALALLMALWLALGGTAAFCRMGAAVAVLLLVFEGALLFFAPELNPAQFHFELELRLRNHYPAAVVLALLHGSACACISAGAALRLCGGGMRPARLGLWVGMAYGMVLLVGNAALLAQPEQLRALQLPFVALTAGWGNAGFYLSAALKFLCAATGLAGLLLGLLPKVSNVGK